MAYVKRTDKEIVAAWERWLESHPRWPKSHPSREMVRKLKKDLKSGKKGEFIFRLHVKNLRVAAKKFKQDPIELLTPGPWNRRGIGRKKSKS